MLSIPKEMVPRPGFINYSLKSEVSTTLCCQLCSTCYTAIRIKDCSSAIKIATMKSVDNFHFERKQGKPSRARTKSTPFPVNKDEWDTNEDTGEIHEECIVRTAVCQKAPVGPKQHRTVKKIKPVTLAVIELRLSEGISQLLTYSVSRKFPRIKKN